MITIEQNISAKIFIEARYIGRSLHRARTQNKITRKELAKKLKITDRELLQIECGRAVIPSGILTKLLRAGIKDLND